MSIDSRVVAGILYIKVTGRFDFSLHNDFREAIKLAEKDIRQIEIDFSKTDYLDSSALGMLLVMRDKLVGDKNVVQIKNARNEVKKILEIANFDKLFILS